MPDSTIIELRIHGMTCAGCVARVEAALSRVEGVESAAVNLLTESARATLSPAAPNAPIGPRLLDAVRAAGYDAEVIPSTSRPSLPAASDEHVRQTLRRHRQALIIALGPAPFIILLDHWGPHVFGHGPANELSYRLLQFVLFGLMAAGPAGAPVLVGGLRAAWHRAPNMELLITLGVVSAIVSSIFGVFVARDASFVHLHAAAMILGLVCLGRYLEAAARGRATAALAALAGRSPRSALVQRGARFVEAPIDQISVGDIVQVPVHRPIPVDGEIVDGHAAVDESLMTGEPRPVHRGPGDRVLGGSLVTEGVVRVRASATGRDSALGRIVRMVAEAQAGRTRMQRLADRVAAVFTPFVLAAAMLTFVAWVITGGRDGVSGGARAAIAVLVVACPCALGLATPTVVAVASGAAALRGILVRDPAMLETMGAVQTIVWDKTGTLTIGRPKFHDVRVVGDHSPHRCLALAAAVEQLSTHPLARAIVDEARAQGGIVPAAAEFESHPGRGAVGRVEGVDVAVGSVEFIRSRGVDVAPIEAAAASRAPSAQTASERTGGGHGTDVDPEQASLAACGVPPGAAIVALAVNQRPAAAFLLTDALRVRAPQAVARLDELGLRQEMVTGDSNANARFTAAALGLDSVRAEVSPEGKAAHVRALREAGERVAMIGDGVNDAPALAAADVGVAFATGAEIAGEAAGIHIVGDNPAAVADAVVLARAGVRLMRQNLFWAFAYNVIMIPLAAAGRLPPSVAAAAMMISSLTVVLNALRLPRVAGWSRAAAGGYHSHPV